MAPFSTLHRKQETKIDSISDLPEPILCHILSFLPIRDQISTSSLSKTWLSLWTFFVDLDIDFTVINNNPDRIPKIVNTVLHRRRHCSIRKFRLRFSSGFDAVNKLVSTAISRNVQELELQQSLSRQRYVLDLVSCKNLSVLKLGGEVFIKDGESNVRFPSLKSLHINWVGSVQNLLSGCPVLEDLAVNRCWGVVRVCVPTLRCLFVNIANIVPCDLELDVPAVECFAVEGFYFSTRFWPSDHLGMLLTAISNVKSLNLSCYWETTVPAHFDGFPVFNNLVRLEICIFMTFSDEWNLILRLLESCHKLENIFISKHGIGQEVPTENWIQPSVVPKCFSSRLKTFHFQGLNNSEGEMGFAVYVLENAMVLKNMVVRFCSLSTEERCSVVNKLTTAAVGSMACKLIIK